MINITNLEEEIIQKDIDKNSSILIIGEASNNNEINKIIYYESKETVLNVYGDSELLTAYITAKDIGAKHIFLCNIKRKEDYIDIIEVVKQYDFAYVIPLNLFASDYFYDANRSNKKIFYAQYLIESISNINNSLFIFTDKHASLYETFDLFLKHYKSTANLLKANMSINIDKSNLCVVANNIKDCLFSNVILGAALSITDAGKYPKFKQYDVLYDIDIFDIGQIELSYFKSHEGKIVTIENLLNFLDDIKPEKIITVDRIVKYIKRNLDLSYFCGQLFRPYQKIKIEEAIDKFLEPMIGNILLKYKITNIEMIKEQAGVGRIEVFIDIWPVNSIESFTILIEG